MCISATVLILDLAVAIVNLAATTLFTICTGALVASRRIFNTLISFFNTVPVLYAFTAVRGAVNTLTGILSAFSFDTLAGIIISTFVFCTLVRLADVRHIFANRLIVCAVIFSRWLVVFSVSHKDDHFLWISCVACV